MIRLSLDNCDTPPDRGFELGYVTVQCGNNVYSSRARGLVMIYLAATDLLDGARLLLTHPDSSYVFIGAGSDWSFAVRRTRHRGLQVTTPAGAMLGVVPQRDYLVAVWDGVQQLITERPPAHGAAWSDLSAAMDAYPTLDKPRLKVQEARSPGRRRARPRRPGDQRSEP
jgi:hypothetical protein